MRAHVSTRRTHTGEREREENAQRDSYFFSDLCSGGARPPGGGGRKRREGGREERKFCPGMSDEDDFDIVHCTEFLNEKTLDTGYRPY